jgi:hypothetical protein
LTSDFARAFISVVIASLILLPGHSQTFQTICKYSPYTVD